MKKVLAMILALSMALTLAACGESSPEADTGGDETATTDPIVVSVAHTSADTASHHQAALEFERLFEEATDGRYDVQVYCNAVMGTDLEMVESVQHNNLSMAGTGFPYIGNFVPEVGVLDVPFRYKDNEVAYQIFADQDLIDGMNKYMIPSGMRLVGCEFSGFRTLTANKEIHVPEDLAGLKVRVQENTGHIETWSTLGANPTPLAYNELYTALQQRTVDAQENPVELIYTQKFYEQQEYIIECAWIPFPLAWVVSEDFWQSMSAEDQSLYIDCLNQAMQVGIEYNEEMMDSYYQAFEDYGCTIIKLTDEEYALWQEAAEPMLAYYEEQVGSDVYNIYMDVIAKYST